MSKQLRVASLIAVTATMISTIVGTAGSGAFAQEKQPQAVIEEPFTPAYPAPVESESPALPAAPAATVEPAAETPAREISAFTAGEPESGSQAVPQAVMATSLAELVRVQPQEELDRELNCLAGAIYFEAKGESLPGQLAVGRVVVARAKSGRFPGSYCGVVYQPSQFSFVRGRSMPAINKGSRHWRNAVAIAQIADDGSWRSPVEGALFFHAAHVSPGWRLKRVARIDNHIFYR